MTRLTSFGAVEGYNILAHPAMLIGEEMGNSLGKNHDLMERNVRSGEGGILEHPSDRDRACKQTVKQRVALVMACWYT